MSRHAQSERAPSRRWSRRHAADEEPSISEWLGGSYGPSPAGSNLGSGGEAHGAPRSSEARYGGAETPSGTSSGGTSSGGTSSGGTSSGGTSYDPSSYGGDASGAAPSYGTSSYGSPSHGSPSYSSGSYGTASYQPASSEPASTQSGYLPPTSYAPASYAPASYAPAANEPSSYAPAANEPSSEQTSDGSAPYRSSEESWSVPGVRTSQETPSARPSLERLWRERLADAWRADQARAEQSRGPASPYEARAHEPRQGAPHPPAYEPPAYPPPAYPPPAYPPPAYPPPAYQPPAYQPPAHEPPRYEPPAPPVYQPPAYQPPAYEPARYQPPPVYQPRPYEPAHEAAAYGSAYRAAEDAGSRYRSMDAVADPSRPAPGEYTGRRRAPEPDPPMADYLTRPPAAKPPPVRKPTTPIPSAARSRKPRKDLPSGTRSRKARKERNEPPVPPADRAGRLRLRINPITCDGHGLCAELLPELVSLDDWGYPMPVVAEVPTHLEGHAQRAAQQCPTLAIILERRQPRDPR